MQNDTAALEDSLVVPYKTKHAIITMQSVIVLPGIYTKELSTYVQTKTYMWMFIVALFISAKLGSNQNVLQYVNR